MLSTHGKKYNIYNKLQILYVYGRHKMLIKHLHTYLLIENRCQMLAKQSI